MKLLSQQQYTAVSGGNLGVIRTIFEAIGIAIIMDDSGRAMERGFRESSRESFSDYYDYVDTTGRLSGYA
ncbi:hypothetical protein LJ739_13465 [Aestuariibacter halophilus]|uniref:Uncharacterized protein n=1 Tax=Fluctibacter halophilus TaxID=226011 RepID=A0ABS8GB08_9ALTE|nr:hypothetical protein [Aestuariibacter halophilus]MCC2617256.1 hypothetical protein [Aestuariibacter halophilus]